MLNYTMSTQWILCRDKMHAPWEEYDKEGRSNPRRNCAGVFIAHLHFGESTLEAWKKRVRKVHQRLVAPFLGKWRHKPCAHRTTPPAGPFPEERRQDTWLNVHSRSQPEAMHAVWGTAQGLSFLSKSAHGSLLLVTKSRSN